MTLGSWRRATVVGAASAAAGKERTMNAADVATVSGPHAGLLDWLASHRIEHELHEHPLTYTARETARAEGVDPATFAKTLGIATDDGRHALVVVDATDQVDLVKARRVLDAGRVRLMTEAELTEWLPGCDVGTMPPVGELFGLPVYADFAVREDPVITFHAGSHRFAVLVDRGAWERAAHVTYGDLAIDVDTRPAWIRS